MYFYQISYIDDCDDVDELMGVYHEVWRSLWQLHGVEHDHLFTDSEFMCKYMKSSYGSCS